MSGTRDKVTENEGKTKLTLKQRDVSLNELASVGFGGKPLLI